MALTVPAKKRRRLSSSTNRAGIIFVIPYLILLMMFAFGPTVYALYDSFVNERFGTGTLGLQNYGWVLSDFRFWPAVEHVGLYMLYWIPFMVVSTVAFALMLHHKTGKTSSALRLIYFLPGAVTGSASVLLWVFMLTPQYSPFGPALNAMGLHSVNQIFVVGNLPWIFALMAFATGAGGWIVVLFGAFQSIPPEVLEAALVDGAGPIRTALSIKLPLIRKYLYYMVILSFAGATQIFIEPMLISKVEEGAGSAWWSLNQLAVDFAFNQGDFGSASVVSVMLLIISLIAGLILVRTTDFFATEVDPE